MLSLREVKNPEQKKQIRDTEFDASHDVWLVSDLKTKLFISNELLHRHGAIAGEPIMRASEFWRELLQSHFPEYLPLSRVSTRLCAQNFLSSADEKIPWVKRPHAPDFLIQVLAQYSSLMAHPDPATDVSDPLLNIAKDFFDHLILQKRIFVENLPAWLRHMMPLVKLPKIWVDLGIYLSAAELDFLDSLSATNEIIVVAPIVDRVSERSGLYLYQQLKEKLGEKSKDREPLSDLVVSKITLQKYSSPLAETRGAVETIRSWIAEGVKPSEICVTAPDTKSYLRFLNGELSWEGIGIDTPIETSYSSVKVFRLLSARLKIASGEINADLVREAFLSQKKFAGTRNQFFLNRQVSLVETHDDIYHDGLRESATRLAALGRGTFTESAFEELVFQIFNQVIKDVDAESNESLTGDCYRALTKILQQVRLELNWFSADLASWISVFQVLLSRANFSVHPAEENGIHVADLHSIEEIPATHLIILGFTQEAEESGLEALPLSDSEHKRFKELGFFVERPCYDRVEEEVRWQLMSAKKKIILSSVASNLEGKSATGHPLWIELAQRQGRGLHLLDAPTSTNWVGLSERVDEAEIQNELAEAKKLPSSFYAKNFETFKNESLHERHVVIEGYRPKKISASRIEDYFSCPYIDFSKSVLKLDDEPDIELEMNPMDRGILLHQWAEKLLNEDKPIEAWSAELLEALVDDTVDLQKIGDQRLWPGQKRRLLKILDRFKEFEKNFRRERPKLKTLAVEKIIKGFVGWDKTRGELCFAKTEETFRKDFSGIEPLPFSGKVDRIDSDGSFLLIIDYKSGVTALDNSPKWHETGEFQLAFYTFAVEAGIVDLPTSKVAGAIYYGLKRLDRSLGFRIRSDQMFNLYDLEGRKNAFVSDFESRDQILNKVKISVGETFEKILSGNFDPSPLELTQCKKCSWNKICRAPHLL